MTRLLRGAGRHLAQVTRRAGRGLRAPFMAWRRRRRLIGNARAHSQAVASAADGGPDSIDVLRARLLQAPLSPGVWRKFGQVLVAEGRSDAALEAFIAATAYEPCDVVALEMLEEVATCRGAPRWIVEASVRRLGEAADPSGAEGCVAFTYAVRFGHFDLVSRFCDARDPSLAAAARGVMSAVEPPGVIDLGRVRAVLDAQDDPRSRLLILCGLGEWEAAARVAADLGAVAVPSQVLRIAARRALAEQSLGAAHGLLSAYVTLEPGNRWARKKVAEIGLVAGRQLRLEGGFRVPPRRPQTAYVPNPARVVYLTHNSLPLDSAGYAIRSHGLLKALRERGWQVDAYTRPGYGHDDECVDGILYRRLHLGSVPNPKEDLEGYVRAYADLVAGVAQRSRPFVIHAASNHWNGLAAALAARRLGIRYIYEVRGFWELTMASRDPAWAGSSEYRLMKQLEGVALKHADAILTLTDGLRAEILERGGDERKITLVPNGVDAARFARPEIVPTRGALGIPARDITIGYIGSLLDYEGLDLLVEAVGMLLERALPVNLVVIGDGPERERLVALAARRLPAGRFTFVERVSQESVPGHYRLLDVAAFPRRPWPVCERVSPIKPVEASAAGVPIVVSDVVALAEMVRQGRNGLVHLPGDANDLSRKLEHLVTNAALRRELGRRGQEWASQSRDWAIMSAVVGDVYGQVYDLTRR